MKLKKYDNIFSLSSRFPEVNHHLTRTKKRKQNSWNYNDFLVDSNLITFILAENALVWKNWAFNLHKNCKKIIAEILYVLDAFKWKFGQ